MDDLVATLADHVVVRGQPDNSVRRAARRTVLNAVALAVGASASPAVEVAAQVVHMGGPAADASVLGRGQLASAPWAALVNAVGVHVEDYDDTHLGTVVHPGAPVVPVALALAERADRSMGEVLEAVAVGAETMLRLGAALSPGVLQRGWHVTAVLGPVGAAAAGARLLALDAAATERAIGRALLRSSGVQSALGSMVKALQVGRAAFAGCESALLVAAGADGPRGSFGGLEGVAAAYAGELSADPALDGLGERWLFTDNAFKPYACGIVSHPAIDAACDLAERVGVADVARIEVHANPLLTTAMGLQEPTDGTEAKFSAAHAIAVGLVHRNAGPAQFTTDVVHDPVVAGIRRLVSVTEDAAVPLDAARLLAHLTDGSVVEVDVPHARGSRARPLSDADLAAKATELVRPVLGSRSEELLAALTTGEELPARRIAHLTCPFDGA